MIYLLTAIGLSPDGSSTVNIYTQTIHRKIQNKQYIEQHNNFGRVRAVHRLGLLSWNLWASKSRNPRGLSRAVHFRECNKIKRWIHKRNCVAFYMAQFCTWQKSEMSRLYTWTLLNMQHLLKCKNPLKKLKGVTGRHATSKRQNSSIKASFNFQMLASGGEGRGVGRELSQYANGFHFDKIFARTGLFCRHSVPFTFALTNV